MRTRLDSHNIKDDVDSHKQTWMRVRDPKERRRLQNRLAKSRQRLRERMVKDPSALPSTYTSQPVDSGHATSGHTSGIPAAMGWFPNVAVAADTEAPEGAEATGPVNEVQASVSIPETAPSPDATISDVHTEGHDSGISHHSLKMTIEPCDAYDHSKKARSTCRIGDVGSASLTVCHSYSFRDFTSQQ